MTETLATLSPVDPPGTSPLDLHPLRPQDRRPWHSVIFLTRITAQPRRSLAGAAGTIAPPVTLLTPAPPQVEMAHARARPWRWTGAARLPAPDLLIVTDMLNLPNGSR